MKDRLIKAMEDMERSGEKLNQIGVHDPQPNKPQPTAETSAKHKTPTTIPEKLREFVNQTGAIYLENPGTPYEKHYATAIAWNYLAHLNNVRVEIEKVWEETDPLDKNAVIVYAEGALIDDNIKLEDDNEWLLTNATMCASTSEKWLKDKPLSAAYGLAQTRLEERLLRMQFGYQLSLARLEPIGAEELDVDPLEYGTKDKEI